MRNNLLLTSVAGITTLLVYAGSHSSSPLRAQAGVALTGLVISEEEERMEGVVVTAHREGSPISISISVVTDATGRFNFPESKLPDGDYLLKIRAIGFELVGPRGIDVRSGVTANTVIKLRETKDLAAQLTNAEWLASMPASNEQKKFLLSCNSWHSYQP